MRWWSVPVLAMLAACSPLDPAPAVFPGLVVVQPGPREPVLVVDAKTGKRVAEVALDGYASAPPGAGQLFFVHGDAGIVGRRVEDGHAVWRELVKAPTFRPLATSDGAVFVYQEQASRPRYVALAAGSGAKLYEVACDRAAPLVAAGDQVATFVDGQLVVHAAEDGKERYRVQAELEPPLLLTSARLFVRSGDELAVIKADTGRIERRIAPGDASAFDIRHGHPTGLAVGQGWVATLGDDQVSVFDPDTGTRRFVASVPSASLLGGGGQHLAVGAGDRAILIDATTGKKRLDLDVGGTVTALTLEHGLLAVRTTEELLIVDAAAAKQTHRVRLKP